MFKVFIKNPYLAKPNTICNIGVILDTYYSIDKIDKIENTKY